MKKEKFNYNDLASMNNEEARKVLESTRWADGRFCPHCGCLESYQLKPKADSKRPVREGVYKCKDCRKQFTVTVGTIFEGSHIKLGIWLAVIHLACASKKGISALQISRMFPVTYKSAWFMMHRIRYAMTEPEMTKKMSGTVEADETYIGGKSKGKRGRGAENKSIIFSLVERDGKIKSQKVDSVSSKNLGTVLRENVNKNATLMTDEFKSYKRPGKEFADHQIVSHGKKEYVRGTCHTNTVEGFFSLLKRGIHGSYHHVSKQHLDFYVNEFDFRYNNRKISDIQRTMIAIKGFAGKRLMYHNSNNVLGLI